MVWEVETECDPREGAHCWGKDDLVGDVTCLATHRFIGHPHSLHLHITKTFPTQWASLPWAGSRGGWFGTFCRI